MGKRSWDEMLFFSARTKNVRLKGHFLGTDVFRLVRTDPRCVGEPSVTHYCRMDINNYGLCVDKAGVFRVQRCPFPVHVFNGLDLSINYWEGNAVAQSFEGTSLEITEAIW